MKRKDKLSREEVSRGYQVFMEFPEVVKKKKIDLEQQQYVVPWELVQDTKKAIF